MKHILISFVALLLFTLPAHEIVHSQGISGTPVPIIPLHARSCPTCAFTYNSGLTKPVQLVIKDSKEWQEVWERSHCKVISPVPPLPEIDFTKELIVVVALGTRPTGGYGIFVDRAVDKNNRREITVGKQSPGKNCFTTQALTQPVDIARLPKTDRPVVFKETGEVHECK